MKRVTSLALVAALVLMGTGAQSVNAQRTIKMGIQVADFPPGTFSDGGHYQLSDFRGKVLVLFFFESTCPTCRGLVPERNKLVEQFKDQPVKFIAVGAHDPLADVLSYIQDTHLEMTTFADPFRAMEHSYGEEISLENIYQFRVIGPEGQLWGVTGSADEIQAAVGKVHWKFKDKGYDPALNAAINLFEWNQWEAGMKLLAPLRKAYDKKVAASAESLYTQIKTEQGQSWKEQADKISGDQPVEAYDLYTRISAVFTGDDLAKSVAAPLKALSENKAVTDELSARQMYAQLPVALGRADVTQKSQVLQFCAALVAKYPGTPTAAKVQSYIDNIK